MLNSNVLDKPKSSIPLIGKAQILNPNVWKNQNHQFKVWKRLYPQFKRLEKQEIKNSTVWKNQNPQLQCLEKHKS